jgi:methionyl-tRNA synthetase
MALLHSVAGRLKSTPEFDWSWIRCTWTMQQKFTDLWYTGTSIQKRHEVSCDNIGHHAVLSPRMLNEYIHQASSQLGLQCSTVYLV